MHYVFYFKELSAKVFSKVAVLVYNGTSNGTLIFLKIFSGYRLLSCIVSDEKFDVILIFSFHVKFLFSLVAFKVFLLSFIFTSLNVICQGEVYCGLLTSVFVVCCLSFNLGEFSPIMLS